MEVAAAKRFISGRSISSSQSHHQGLDQSLCPALSTPGAQSYSASPERHTGQVGNEEVQEIALPSHESGILAGADSQKAALAVSALAVWCATNGWMMGARRVERLTPGSERAQGGGSPAPLTRQSLLAYEFQNRCQNPFYALLPVIVRGRVIWRIHITFANRVATTNVEQKIIKTVIIPLAPNTCVHYYTC